MTKSATAPQEGATAADARRHFIELEALRKHAGQGTPPQPAAPPQQAPTTGLAAPATRGHISPARMSAPAAQVTIQPTTSTTQVTQQACNCSPALESYRHPNRAIA